ncbi:MAG: LON peptidase substrate-binding domain-containing protein [Chloroflexota bacterium]
MPARVISLPLFPLSVVLFPTMTLRLRIFEPRYHQMLADCLAGEQRFGVVLIKEGQEVGEPAMPHEVGTVARILGVEKKSPDLSYITTVGAERFRLRRLVQQRPYLMAEVEIVSLEPGDSLQVASLIEQVTPHLSTYLRLLSRATGGQIKLQRLPTDATTLAYLIAMILQIPAQEKQHLLTIPDLPALLGREQELLRHEVKLLAVMIRAQERRPAPDLPHQTGEPPPFSTN